MSINKILMLTLLSLMLLTGCAIGRKTNYTDGHFNLQLPSSSYKPVSVSVVDQRPYVLKGSHSSTFTGITKSLYGIPYSMHTKSGQPLAVDLVNLINRSLIMKDIIVNESRAEKSPLVRDLVFTLYEWKTETYFRDKFIWDITLEVKDSLGSIIATTRQSGETKIYAPGSGIPTLASQIDTVINNLLNDSEIVGSIEDPDDISLLKESSNTRVGESPKKMSTMPNISKVKKDCSTTQILSMKSMGLSDSQISVACD